MKRLLFCLLLPLLILTALPTLAQTPSVNNYRAVSISLPFSTLAAATSTNLALGWSTTTYVTNTTILFSAASAAFVTNTVISTNTSTYYADFDAQGQRNVALQFNFTMAGATTTNIDFVLAKSVDGVNFETTGRQTISFPANGTTQVGCVTNIDMYGAGFGRIVTVFNRDSTSVATNNGIYVSNFPRQSRQ